MKQVKRGFEGTLAVGSACEGWVQPWGLAMFSLPRSARWLWQPRWQWRWHEQGPGAERQ